LIYAIAHIRGGGELATVAEEQDDGEAQTPSPISPTSAENLVKAKYNQRPPRHSSGSAGGLLMGAVVICVRSCSRPSVAQVPFVDRHQHMLDASLPLTTSEYLNGAIRTSRKVRYIKTYSPYDNIARRRIRRCW